MPGCCATRWPQWCCAATTISTNALRATIADLLSGKRPAPGSPRDVGLDIHYDLGDGHPLLGRRMPDLDFVTDGGPVRVYELLHDARPVVLDLGGPDGFEVAPWAVG